MIVTTAHLVNDHRLVMDIQYSTYDSLYYVSFGNQCIKRTDDFFEALEAARTYRIRLRPASAMISGQSDRHESLHKRISQST